MCWPSESRTKTCWPHTALKLENALSCFFHHSTHAGMLPVFPCMDFSRLADMLCLLLLHCCCCICINVRKRWDRQSHRHQTVALYLPLWTQPA